MNIKHFYDESLAQGAYAVESDGEMAVIDPPRDPKEMIEWAVHNTAKITAVFETHPHADFISSHKELAQITGAKIYFHPAAKAEVEHVAVKHGDTIKIGKVTLEALFTPGHSPDHNSYLLKDESGKPTAIFSGDSLFVGDVGRPDLREDTANVKASRNELASMMYDTVHDVFSKLPDDVTVYPAHGPGSLCGKNLSDDLNSSIGKEKKSNWAFNSGDRDAFMKSFLEGQAFIPQYFANSVELNRRGAPALKSALKNVPIAKRTGIPEGALVIDTRSISEFRKGYLPHSINIRCEEEDKFETWLGSVVAPGEEFYLAADSLIRLEAAVYRAAKIGYEGQINGGVAGPVGDKVVAEEIDMQDFTANPENYTIVDVRNASERAESIIFENSVHIPLNELRARAGELPNRKPVVVHCAGGYRSAVAYSIIEMRKENKVYDLGEDIKSFQETVKA